MSLSRRVKRNIMEGKTGKRHLPSRKARTFLGGRRPLERKHGMPHIMRTYWGHKDVTPEPEQTELPEPTSTKRGLRGLLYGLFAAPRKFMRHLKGDR